MKINELLEKLSLKRIKDMDSVEVKGVVEDSRKVLPGYIFVAVKGEKDNGTKYIDDAVKRGAVFVLADEKENIKPGIPFGAVKNVKRVSWKMVSEFYDCPEKKLKVIGITGTNGKTTTALLIKKVLNQNGSTCGVIGTIENSVGNKVYKTNNTTPGPVELLKLFYDFSARGADSVAMEVSSHALKQGRTGELEFSGAVFTNLSHEHLDYHQTMEDYFFAKKKIFSKTEGFMLSNSDDDYGKRLLKDINGMKSYGSFGDYSFRILENDITGLELEIQINKKWKGVIRSRLMGLHNAYNLLAAFSACIEFGISPDDVVKSISKLDSVNGRLEKIPCDAPFYVFVDYAHTPEALKNVLVSLKHFCTKKIICVFGCGGNRDREKRPRMGKIAEEYCDKIILTSDNSRWEEASVIIDEILSGIADRGKVSIVVDRKDAIDEALDNAREEDFVLIAGRGHEELMEEKGKFIPFCDAEIVRRVKVV
ncbi:MAG: UDP-N-acetylmuramoyl-L-alanyl-D-glutamate--2,6-diaminopimelate ligase [Candidatus Auribacterota bacterium]|nr:UDP-N-acetylmuramoyl-L-alanyl-D-glutamate--2,6-diaminopimelate ligase [Candidatus Auribacterota bacterium]